MQIVVTGAAGFIGGHLAEQFVKNGHDVVALDNFDEYYDIGIKKYNVESARDAAAESTGDYKLVKGDVRDESLVNSLVKDADFVFHQAAQAGVRTSVDDPQKPNSINVDGTLNVLDAARDSRTDRVILASSSSVYGKPQYLPYDENHPTTPVSPYGVSKLAGEQYARVYNEVYGLSTVSLRYFTVYGPRMRPNMAISNFVSRCMHGDSPIIYGEGDQTRDFTYIDDIVEANRSLLQTDAADGEILNIGSTDNISILELASVIRDEIAPNLDLEYADRHEADADHTHADISKASDLLGYEPTTSIRDGIVDFITWYRDNREWYGPLARNS
ncbi:GDP-mannose 4,6-dehydratase [Haladaptatus caseinilyticus]|uniref:GDP-mannose 4,6-dehydratase n=1 Tax=Haladaptatus caseinilyticus TaxID=2993314 RepID=UPI00224A7C89|nr:GDP-mannose 4,6-dehydratase [Haladaptatus caseinilyticus]